MPLLGILFLPYTTIMYMLSWNAVTGISGFDWLWIFLGLMLDLWKWNAVYQNRGKVPGMGSTEPAPPAMMEEASPPPMMEDTTPPAE